MTVNPIEKTYRWFPGPLRASAANAWNDSRTPSFRVLPSTSPTIPPTVVPANEDIATINKGARPPDSSPAHNQLFGPLRKGLSMKKRQVNLKPKLLADQMELEEQVPAEQVSPYDNPNIMIRIEGKLFMKTFKNIDLSKLNLKEIPLELNHFQDAKVLRAHPDLQPAVQQDFSLTHLHGAEEEHG